MPKSFYEYYLPIYTIVTINGDRSISTSQDAIERRNYLFKQIEELVLNHSPSGVETEIDLLLRRKFTALGVENWQDRAGNIIVKIPGQKSARAIAITAHKDEIGMLVKSIDRHGCLQVRRLGGSFPWVYGEVGKGAQRKAQHE